MKRIFSYSVSLIKGLLVTAKYLFSHAVTMQYPKQRWAMPERFRGRVALRHKKCIGCLMCAKACPNYCLEIKTATGEDKKRRPSSFVYRMDTCLFCGLCVEPCPTSAIYMNHEYESSVYDRPKLIMDLVEVDKNVE